MKLLTVHHHIEACFQCCYAVTRPHPEYAGEQIWYCEKIEELEPRPGNIFHGMISTENFDPFEQVSSRCPLPEVGPNSPPPS